MIFPCIDLMDGKVVQLVQGREKALGPAIASGGAGEPEHFVRVLTDGRADAALAAPIFRHETYAVRQLEEELDRRGIPVRRA